MIPDFCRRVKSAAKKTTEKRFFRAEIAKLCRLFRSPSSKQGRSSRKKTGNVAKTANKQETKKAAFKETA